MCREWQIHTPWVFHVRAYLRLANNVSRKRCSSKSLCPRGSTLLFYFQLKSFGPKGSKVSQAWKQELLWLCDGVQIHRRDILQQYSKSSKRKIVRYLLFFVNAENVTLNSSKASLLLWPTYTQTWGNDGEPHRAQIGNGVSTVVHTLKALLFCPPVMVLTIFDAGDGPNWPWLFLWQVSFYQA